VAVKICLVAASIFAATMSAVPAAAADYTDTFIGTVSDGSFLGDPAKLTFTYQYPPSAPATIVTGNVDGGSQVQELANGDPIINAAFEVAGQIFNLSGYGPSYIYRQKNPDGVTETLDIVSGSDPTVFALGDDLSQTHALIDSTDISAPFHYVVDPTDNAKALFKFPDGTFSAFVPTEVTGGDIVSPTPELPAWLSLLVGLIAWGVVASWRNRTPNELWASRRSATSNPQAI
jgi:hypothetical protein